MPLNNNFSLQSTFDIYFLYICIYCGIMYKYSFVHVWQLCKWHHLFCKLEKYLPFSVKWLLTSHSFGIYLLVLELDFKSVSIFTVDQCYKYSVGIKQAGDSLTWARKLKMIVHLNKNVLTAVILYRCNSNPLSKGIQDISTLCMYRFRTSVCWILRCRTTSTWMKRTCVVEQQYVIL